MCSASALSRDCDRMIHQPKDAMEANELRKSLMAQGRYIGEQDKRLQEVIEHVCQLTGAFPILRTCHYCSPTKIRSLFITQQTQEIWC